MKIRYPVIALIILQIIATFLENANLSTDIEFTIQAILPFLDLTLIGIIIYCIIRNIIRSIKNVAKDAEWKRIQRNMIKKEQQERTPWEK